MVESRPRHRSQDYTSQKPNLARSWAVLRVLAGESRVEKYLGALLLSVPPPRLSMRRLAHTTYDVILSAPELLDLCLPENHFAVEPILRGRARCKAARGLWTMCVREVPLTSLLLSGKARDIP